MTLRDDIKHILFNAGLPTSRGEAADAILAAIEEHMTASEAVSWQPISTATKDSSRILSWSNEEGYHVVWADTWMGDDVWMREDTGTLWEWRLANPTHWMPLPATPALKAK
jgi:hypothetical protein